MDRPYQGRNVFLSTLATVHSKHELFGNDLFKCSLLVIDEASQAPEIGVAQALVTLAHPRVVMAGDHKHLGLYVESVDAQAIWRQSLFAKPEKKDAMKLMLDVQYRTEEKIYANRPSPLPTQAHHDSSKHLLGVTE